MYRTNKYFPDNIYIPDIGVEYKIERFELIYEKEIFTNPDYMMTNQKGYTYFISYKDNQKIEISYITGVNLNPCWIN